MSMVPAAYTFSGTIYVIHALDIKRDQLLHSDLKGNEITSFIT